MDILSDVGLTADCSGDTFESRGTRAHGWPDDPHLAGPRVPYGASSVPPPRDADVGGVPTLVAEGAAHRLVTFTVGSDRYVIVARRDEEGLPDLVEAFAGGL